MGYSVLAGRAPLIFPAGGRSTGALGPPAVQPRQLRCCLLGVLGPSCAVCRGRGLPDAAHPEPKHPCSPTPLPHPTPLAVPPVGGPVLPGLVAWSRRWRHPPRGAWPEGVANGWVSAVKSSSPPQLPGALCCWCAGGRATGAGSCLAPRTCLPAWAAVPPRAAGRSPGGPAGPALCTGQTVLSLLSPRGRQPRCSARAAGAAGAAGTAGTVGLGGRCWPVGPYRTVGSGRPHFN